MNRVIIMAAQILIMQIIQILLMFVVIPVLVYYVLRAIIKIKVHKAVYGYNINRYIEDQILEKQAKINREQGGQS